MKDVRNVAITGCSKETQAQRTDVRTAAKPLAFSRRKQLCFQKDSVVLFIIFFFFQQ